ncbi:hypothetical protein CPA50_10230 [Marinobacter sp. ANT_B65]|nr:hypothetical protein CPA50_10230 [Marinobacter sp. ANT_B65]
MVQFVEVGLTVDQGEQRFVGLWVTEVPLPVASGVLFSQQYVIVPQVAGGARCGFAPGPSAQGVVAVDDVPGGVVLTVKAVDKLDHSQQGSEKLNSEYPLSAQDEQNSFLWTQLCRSSAQRMRHLLSGVTVRERPDFYLDLTPK